MPDAAPPFFTRYGFSRTGNPQSPVVIEPYPEVCAGPALRATIIASAIDLVGGLFTREIADVDALMTSDLSLRIPEPSVPGQLLVHGERIRTGRQLVTTGVRIETGEFTARYAVPSFAKRLAESDLSAAYKMHRLVLQIRQRAQPETAWVLKSPVHLHVLPTLLACYPDARIAITHRDPLTLLASLTHLIANLRWAHSDTVNPEAISREHLDRWASTFDRLVDWTENGELPEAQMHHSHLADFQDEPMATMERLYARFGKVIGGQAREAMQNALHAHPADRHGPHHYSRKSGSENQSERRNRFARYQHFFAVSADD